MVADARFRELLRLPLDGCGARLRVGVCHLRRQRLKRGRVAHGDVLKGPRPEGTAGPRAARTAARSVERGTWEPSIDVACGEAGGGSKGEVEEGADAGPVNCTAGRRAGVGQEGGI